MNIKRVSIAVLLMLAVVASGATAVAVAQSEDDPPGFPANFYGNVTDGDDVDAPVGTEVYAVVTEDGDVTDTSSITVEEAGQYGESDADGPKLSVDSEAGDTVRFYVDDPDDGPQASETFDLESEGDGTYNEDLTFSDAEFDIDSISIELDDTSLEPGDTTEATVTAERDSGSDDVTDQATITSTDTDVATVDGATITAEDTGDATIEAELRGQTASVDVSVTEDGGEGDPPGGNGGGAGGGAGTGSGGGSVDVPDISDDLGGDAEISDESEGVIATDSDTGETSVTFRETSNVESITFSEETSGTANVRNIDGTPEATGAPPGTTVSISDITVPEDARDSPATVRKRVSNDRLDEVGAEAEQLSVYRYSDGDWNELDTSASETDSGVVLEAETPGFSYFAVAAAEEQADDGGADDDTADDADDTTDDGIPGFGFVVALVAIIGAALLAARNQ